MGTINASEFHAQLAPQAEPVVDFMSVNFNILNTPNTIFLIFVSFLFGLSLNSSSGETLSIYANGASGNAIYVWGENAQENITMINSSISNPAYLQDLGGKEWLLKVPLIVNDTQATLKITGDDVSWLKMQSNGANNAYIKILGTGIINGAKITSWSATSYDLNQADGRPYLLVYGPSSKASIINSELSYLGYNGGNDWESYYGVAFALSDGNYIYNNTFHNNYAGLNLRGADNNNISSNYNISYNTRQGIMAEWGSSGNKIDSNHDISHNQFGIELAGILNEIKNNYNIQNNTQDGIYAWGNGQNNISYNYNIFANGESGIEAYRELEDNILYNHDIHNNSNDGIRFMGNGSEISYNYNIYSQNSMNGIQIWYFSSSYNNRVMHNHDIHDNLYNAINDGGVNTTVSRNYNIYGNDAGIGAAGTRSLYEGNYGLYFNSRSSIKVTGTSVIVRNNTIYNEDEGIYLYASRNAIVENNTIYNITYAWDGYATGIFVFTNNTNATIRHNNMTDMGRFGIVLLKNNSDIRIIGNHISLLDLNTAYSMSTVMNGRKIYLNSEDQPRAGIMVTELFGSYLSDWTETDRDNRTKMTDYKSRNVAIANNLFGSNVGLLLYSEGTENLVHDLPNYTLYAYYFPRLTDKTELYLSNSLSGDLLSIIQDTNRTTTIWGSRRITNTFKKMYTHIANQPPGAAFGREFFFNYILNARNFTVLPQGYEKYDNATGTINNSDTPYDFYLYSPAFAPFWQKVSKIYSNGTTQIRLYNDILEPRGYSTINMSVMPSSDYLNITVLNWSASGNYYKKWNESAPSDSVSAHHTIGDFPASALIAVKKSGAYWNVIVSNASGYAGFNYSNAYPEIQFEAYEAPLAYLNIQSYFYKNGSASYSGSIEGKTQAGITAFPASGNVSVLAGKFDTSLPAGEISVNLTADAADGNDVAFAVGGLKQSANYRIKKDGAVFLDLKSDAYGKIVFNNSIW